MTVLFIAFDIKNINFSNGFSFYKMLIIDCDLGR